MQNQSKIPAAAPDVPGLAYFTTAPSPKPKAAPTPAVESAIEQMYAYYIAA